MIIPVKETVLSMLAKSDTAYLYRPKRYLT